MDICTLKDDIWPDYPVFWVGVDTDIRIKLDHIIRLERCHLAAKASTSDWSSANCARRSEIWAGNPCACAGMGTQVFDRFGGYPATYIRRVRHPGRGTIEHCMLHIRLLWSAKWRSSNPPFSKISRKHPGRLDNHPIGRGPIFR